MSSRGGRIALLAAIGIAGACASGGTSSTGSGQAAAAGGGGSAVIVVENTESPGRAISVELVSANGQRRLLGQVGPRRTESFEVDGLEGGVSYRLVAGLTGSGNVTSERFGIAPGERITWTLPLNSLHTSS